ncbi:MAG: hypothetical protein ABSE89_12640 [Sedimentisphaerales bacterium]
MQKELLEKLKKINSSDYPDVHSFKKPLEEALWVLLALKYGIKYEDYLSAREISESLLAVGVSRKYIKISRALSRAGDKVDRKKVQGEVKFKIMKKGEEYLRDIGGKDKLSVTYIDGTKPWADLKTIKEFIKNLRGEILIVDKFFGTETLDILAEFETTRKVRFLTAKITTSTDKFSRDIKKFKMQYKNIEIKIYPKEYELHDRYLLTDKEVCLLGHGLKDLGTKESFVIILNEVVGKEIGTTLKSKFEERWLKANPI